MERLTERSQLVSFEIDPAVHGKVDPRTDGSDLLIPATKEDCPDAGSVLLLLNNML